MTRHDDEQDRAGLVARPTDGDADALQRLILVYHPQLRATVATAMPAALGRHLDPDDVLQQAYAAAFQGVAACSFDHPGGFYKWLETIALNQLRDRRRDLQRAKRDVAREVQPAPRDFATSYPDLIDRISGGDGTPSRHVARGEAVAALMTSLARLTDEQRAVVNLRVLHSRSLADVARALGKTETAIHALTHRALKELRRLMVSVTRYISHPSRLRKPGTADKRGCPRTVPPSEHSQAPL